MDRLIRSDILPHVVELTEAMPALAALWPRVLQMRLVFDANRVHAELRWRLTRRKNPSDRSAIHEAIVAGVVVLFAPEQLKSEIAKYLEDIAEDTGVSVADVQREWELFQKHLCFYEPKSRPSSAESYADVDDFPYLATLREVDTQAVYTSDRHLAAMHAPVVSAFIDTHLRDYARASSVQIVLQLGSSFSVIVSWEFLCAAYRLFTRSIQALKRLPPAAQVVLAGVTAAAVLNPKSREKLIAGWNSLFHSEAAALVWKAINHLVLTADAAKRDVDNHYSHLHTVVPAQQRRPLLHHIRAVCVAAGSGINLDELERRVRRGGYESRSKTSRQYLCRILRSDESFIELAPGLWSLRTTSGSPN
ncbi:PIN domain-containing protein [Edaphobacter albus]|uniref:hypothetical protein n=1 Tax=Edaphobacter sp. 4G125 TaxID=2763071 RepID=UPI001643FBAC|nr:hypothetical protein [Edaphobacter sp. 4G125]QNI37695.1 hypothetical protein H7846_05240 [Edaphobacter sp. 4G125]